MTDIAEYSASEPSPYRAHPSSPDDVAMRLAFIGDEMQVRWTLPGRAHSLAFTYSRMGVRGVLGDLLSVRERARVWGFLTLRAQVPPTLGRELALSLVLLLLVGWGLRLL